MMYNIIRIILAKEAHRLIIPQLHLDSVDFSIFGLLNQVWQHYTITASQCLMTLHKYC